MADKTFDEGCAELAALVGGGFIHGEVEVDQVYAHYQHEGLDFEHPRGGQALYLQEPLMEGFTGWLEEYAKVVLEGAGVDAVKEAMEDLAGHVATMAPVEFGNLRASAHPSVMVDGEIVYDRPPLQFRLSEEELRLERGEFEPPSVAKEHEAAWLIEHPGEPGPARSPASHARMERWLYGEGLL